MSVPSEDSAADTAATLAYAQRHRLPELIDLLMHEVAAAEPANPVSFMGGILQRRIASRDGAAAFDPQLAAALPMHFLSSDGRSTMAAPEADIDAQAEASSSAAPVQPLVHQCIAHFGIWMHIRYADLPTIVERFEQQLSAQSFISSPDATENMEFFIQMLATAAVAAHFKGYREATKLLPARAAHFSSQMCDVLTNTILESTPNATQSQRSDFIFFMRQITRILSGDLAAYDARMIGGICAVLDTDEALWGHFKSLTQRELALFDPVMAEESYRFNLFVRRILAVAPEVIDASRDAQALTASAELPARVQERYGAAARETLVDVLPDRAAVFSALLLRGLQQCFTSRQFTRTALESFTDVLGDLLELTNTVAKDVPRPRLCVRLTGPSLLRGCAHFFSGSYDRMPFVGTDIAGFESAHKQRADAFLRAATEPYGRYSEEMAEAFVKVASCVAAAQRVSNGGRVDKGGSRAGGGVIHAEPFLVRCYHQAYRSLLLTLVSLVRLRATLNAKAFLVTIARSLCFGAPPGNLHLHFQGAFAAAQTPPPQAAVTAMRRERRDPTWVSAPAGPALTPITATEREQAKVMLSALQAICVLALRSPVLHDIALSLSLLAESAEVRRALPGAFATTFPPTELPPKAVAEFLEAHEVLNRLVACFSCASLEGGVEQYFTLTTTIAARLRICRVYAGEHGLSARAVTPATTTTAPPTSATAPQPLPSPSCEFFSMALLAASAAAAPALPPPRAAAALAAVVGLGPAIHATAPTPVTAQDRAVLYAYLHNIQGLPRLLMRAAEDVADTFHGYQLPRLRGPVSYEMLQTSLYELLTALLRVPDDEVEAAAAMTALLRPVAVRHAVAGAVPRDYDLFGLSLSRALRGPGFPEREWTVFYLDVSERIVALLPVLPAVSSYSTAAVEAAVRIQRGLQRWRARSVRRTRRDAALHQLESLLGGRPQAAATGAQTAMGYGELRRPLSLRRGRVIQLCWEALSPEERVTAVYLAATPLAGPDAAPMLLDHCRTLVDSFTLLIAALVPPSWSGAGAAAGLSAGGVGGGEDQDWDEGDGSWEALEEVWHERFGHNRRSFLDGCIAEGAVHTVGEQLVAKVCAKVGCDHPDIRMSWVSFMCALSTLITK